MREFYIDNKDAIYYVDGNPIENGVLMASAFSQFYYSGNKQMGYNHLITPAVRWVSRDRRKYILEQSPSFHFYYNSEGDSNKEIPHPWTVYGVITEKDYTIRDIWVYARNHPISSEEDHLHLNPTNLRVFEDDITRIPQEIINFIREETSVRTFTRSYNYRRIKDWELVRPIEQKMLNILPEGWKKDFENYGEYLEYLESMSLEEMNYSEFKESGLTVGTLIDFLKGLTKETEIESVFDYLRTAFPRKD